MAQKSWPVYGSRCCSFLSQILCKLLHRHHINQNIVAGIRSLHARQIDWPHHPPLLNQLVSQALTNTMYRTVAGYAVVQLNSISSYRGYRIWAPWFMCSLESTRGKGRERGLGHSNLEHSGQFRWIRKWFSIMQEPGWKGPQSLNFSSLTNCCSKSFIWFGQITESLLPTPTPNLRSMNT